jgi:hypothetical protein
MAPNNDIETIVDEDAPGPPIAVPDSGDTGDGGRLKMIVQLLKKAFGVKDIAAMFVPPQFLFSTMTDLRHETSESGVFLYLPRFWSQYLI